MLLSDRDLTHMRATAELALPGTAVITRGTVTSNSGGGGSVTYNAAGTFDCRIASMRGVEHEVGDRISAEADWVVTLPALTDVRVDDRIVTGGGTFSVMALRAPHSYEVTRRVEVRGLT